MAALDVPVGGRRACSCCSRHAGWPVWSSQRLREICRLAGVVLAAAARDMPVGRRSRCSRCARYAGWREESLQPLRETFPSFGVSPAPSSKPFCKWLAPVERPLPWLVGSVYLVPSTKKALRIVSDLDAMAFLMVASTKKALRIVSDLDAMAFLMVASTKRLFASPPTWTRWPF